MLFLGAGASKPLGVPTMKGFTEAVLKDLEKRGAHYEHLVASIKNYISNLGIEPDIEAVLTILEGKANPRKNLENLAAQQMVFPEEFSEASEKTVAWVAFNEIEDSIYNICSGVIPQLATRVYDFLTQGAVNRLRTVLASAGLGFILYVDFATRAYWRETSRRLDPGLRLGMETRPELSLPDSETRKSRCGGPPRRTTASGPNPNGPTNLGAIPDGIAHIEGKHQTRTRTASRVDSHLGQVGCSNHRRRYTRDLHSLLVSRPI